ncbi:MAG: 7-cyano-7-deazaguanine synthase [Planctomycetia bacterium]|nr:7-cyano-7-deazaguanine synthase [Planctomycetia bacterium]
MTPDSVATPASVAVLVSGGLDSAILTGRLLQTEASVQPIYISTALAWEAAELFYLRRFLEAIQSPGLRQLKVLQQPTADLYEGHWSVTGADVPDASTPDEAVYLPGRNPLLLVKAAIWCRLHEIAKLALAPLGSNPFPDATPEFFDGFGRLMSQATGGPIEILRPFAGLHKREVMELGKDLPLERTFSCIHPVGMDHCGTCNKCAERRGAFAAAGLPDPTRYASDLNADEQPIADKNH